MILSSIIETWDKQINRKISYLCDSDSRKWGKYFHGIKCLSPKELIAIKNDPVVFVTIGDYKEVFNSLKKKKFPSVNLLYKYDLEASRFLINCNILDVVGKLIRVYSYLSDAQSKRVFLSIINRVLDEKAPVNIMAGVYEPDQYFPSDVINLTKNESFVDIGAFDGDTIRDFIKRVRGRFDNIFSFEVNKNNFKLLRKSIDNIPNNSKIKIYNFGISDKEYDIRYSFGDSQSTIGVGTGKGHVKPLDNVLSKKKVTFIKMDIEGAELNALRGSKEIIKSQKPKLAISVYHDFKHLWEVPLYIKKLVPDYKIYFRHHTNLEYETVCYAIL
jgi:FkbM family methyltransferase